MLSGGAFVVLIGLSLCVSKGSKVPQEGGSTGGKPLTSNNLHTKTRSGGNVITTDCDVIGGGEPSSSSSSSSHHNNDNITQYVPLENDSNNLTNGSQSPKSRIEDGHETTDLTRSGRSTSPNGHKDAVQKKLVKEDSTSPTSSTTNSSLGFGLNGGGNVTIQDTNVTASGKSPTPSSHHNDDDLNQHVPLENNSNNLTSFITNSSLDFRLNSGGDLVETGSMSNGSFHLSTPNSSNEHEHDVNQDTPVKEDSNNLTSSTTNGLDIESNSGGDLAETGSMSDGSDVTTPKQPLGSSTSRRNSEETFAKAMQEVSVSNNILDTTTTDDNVQPRSQTPKSSTSSSNKKASSKTRIVNPKLAIVRSYLGLLKSNTVPRWADLLNFLKRKQNKGLIARQRVDSKTVAQMISDRMQALEISVKSKDNKKSNCGPVMPGLCTAKQAMDFFLLMEGERCVPHGFKQYVDELQERSIVEQLCEALKKQDQQEIQKLSNVLKGRLGNQVDKKIATASTHLKNRQWKALFNFFKTNPCCLLLAYNKKEECFADAIARKYTRARRTVTTLLRRDRSQSKGKMSRFQYWKFRKLMLQVGYLPKQFKCI